MMQPMLRKHVFGLSALLFSLVLGAQQPTSTPRSDGPPQSSVPAQHLFFSVTLGSSFHERQSGRLLIFLHKGTGERELGGGFLPGETWIAAREVDALAPGSSVDVDADDIAYPKPFSQAPDGDYQVQALLDTRHDYNYEMAGGDPQSAVETLNAFHPANTRTAPINLALESQRQGVAAFANDDPQWKPPSLAAGIEPVHFQSPALTRFWGRPVFITAYVVLPPAYATGQERYPTVYMTHGFGGNAQNITGRALALRKMMEEKSIPPMIFVWIDESFPTGCVEFADSVNNGPWGRALTEEFIPMLEKKYRMDGKPSGRLLNGHSSGGWATLWLQVAYPKIFGGTWSTAPDPSNFHNFTGPDLYTTHANVYRKADGSPYMLVRMNGKDVASLEDFAKQEAVFGPVGGQMASFDWVFSPKSPSGAPALMFNRVTGDVNPDVVKYWGEHYDIAKKVEREWPENARYLKGKIHLIVGTADTFHLDESARLLQQVLDRLAADARFTYLPGKTHGDLYEANGDRMALMKQITKEMYAVARPGN